MPGLTLITAENATLEYSKDGTRFVKLPFEGDISASGGEAPENDVVTFSRIGKVVGHPRVPSLSVAIPSYVPNLVAWTDILDALTKRTPLTWRLTTAEAEFFTASGAGNTVAIATTGAVTFAGTKPDFMSDEFAEGMAIRVGTAKYTIDAISDAGAVTVRPAPTTTVPAATEYRIINPSLRLGPFTASVRSAGNFELAAEGNLSTTLELTPRAQLPAWVIV
ncbi:MAG: hypothetical protein F4156_09860 [Holophagales bacterium]|nr:hypothetical protein [Holophagales bacterium]